MDSKFWIVILICLTILTKIESISRLERHFIRRRFIVLVDNATISFLLEANAENNSFKNSVINAEKINSQNSRKCEHDNWSNSIRMYQRQIRSFGCNGIKDRNEFRCRLHCRSMGYKTGFCTAVTQFEDCVCSRSSPPRSRNSNIFPMMLNITRL